MSAKAESGQLAPGLYLVATPIGNLEDITLRALRVLKQAAIIACEDTRQTQKLLHHYGITTRTVSYHEHNEGSRAEELVKQLEEGASVAVVTDAGTPAISDPGFRVAALAVEHGIPVFPIPGPAAFLAALVASGLPADNFEFRGFLPARSGQRRQALQAIKDSDHTQVFYEAPHRIGESVRDIVEVLGSSRPIVVAREVTKLHEEFLRGTAADVLGELESRGEVRGEITLLIGKSAGQEQSAGESKATVKERVERIMREDGVDEKGALKKAAKELGLSKSEAYRQWQREK